MAVQQDKAANRAKARELIAAAAAAGCAIAVLPEMFNCPYESTLFAQYAERYTGSETVRMLRQAAREHKLTVVGGSIPESDGEHIYNTCFVFDETGRLCARHRKIHLFDVDISGGTSFCESSVLSPGNQPTLVRVGGVTLGIGICYDVRFPELARFMALYGADVLIYPAAFGLTTGPAHWELLMRARAVDNQVFVVAAAPAATPGADYQAYGHSMVVSPWGQIVAEAGNQPELLVVDLPLAQLAEVREQLPLLKHRRPGVYAVGWKDTQAFAGEVDNLN